MKHSIEFSFFTCLFLGILGCSPTYIQGTATYLQLKKELEQAQMDNKNYQYNLATCKEENITLKEQLDQSIGAINKDTLLVSKKVDKPVLDTTTNTPLKYSGQESSLIRDLNNNLSSKLKVNNQDFYVYKVEDPKTIQLFWKEKNQLISNLGNLQKTAHKANKKLIFGMNAGIFRPDRSPEGLYIQEGQVKIALNTKQGKGNFYLAPNGVFYIDKAGKAGVRATQSYLAFVKTLQPKTTAHQINYATQSGPMLVVDGQIHPAFNETSTSLHIRNGVGVDPNGKVIFLISDKRVNLYTFASIFKEHFNCTNALYLDGAISKAYIPELKKTELQGNFGPLIGIFQKR